MNFGATSFWPTCFAPVQADDVSRRTSTLGAGRRGPRGNFWGGRERPGLEKVAGADSGRFRCPKGVVWYLEAVLAPWTNALAAMGFLLTRPRRQRRPKRSLSMRLGEKVQEVLRELALVLSACKVLSHRPARPQLLLPGRELTTSEHFFA